MANPATKTRISSRLAVSFSSRNDGGFGGGGTPPPIFLFILCLAFFVRVGAYALFPGLVHPDEIFQYAEAAHRLVFGEGIVPWEYRADLRSWIFPGMLAGVMQAARLIGDGPVVQSAAVALFLSLLSLPSVACCMVWGRQAAGVGGAVAAGVLAAAWSEMVLMSVHPLLDGVGADFLVPGVFLLQRAVSNERKWQVFISGLMLGLTLVFRLQLAPAIGWAMLRLCGARPVSRGLPVSLGFAVPVLLSGALDWVTLGSPFQSVLRYASLNMHGAADFFGTSPWYTYLWVLLISAGWLFPLMAVCVGAGVGKLPLQAELCLVILIALSVVPHKEARFIFPMFPFLAALAGAGSARLAGRFGTPRGAVALGGGWLILCGINAPFSGSAAQWRRGLGVVEEMHRVSADPHACALAFTPPKLWYLTRGTTHLRPDIALVGLPPDNTTGPLTGFDYAMAFEDTDLSRHGLRLIECRETGMWEKPGLKICLWRNPMGCGGTRPPLLTGPDSPFS
jgi:phosphatidylinositol glycan class B